MLHRIVSLGTLLFPNGQERPWTTTQRCAYWSNWFLSISVGNVPMEPCNLCFIKLLQTNREKQILIILEWGTQMEKPSDVHKKKKPCVRLHTSYHRFIPSILCHAVWSDIFIVCGSVFGISNVYSGLNMHLLWGMSSLQAVDFSILIWTGMAMVMVFVMQVNSPIISTILCERQQGHFVGKVGTNVQSGQFKCLNCKWAIPR